MSRETGRGPHAMRPQGALSWLPSAPPTVARHEMAPGADSYPDGEKPKLAPVDPALWTTPRAPLPVPGREGFSPPPADGQARPTPRVDTSASSLVTVDTSASILGVAPSRGTPYVSRGRDGRRLPWCRRTGRLFVLAGCKSNARRLAGKVCPCGQLDCMSCAEGPKWRDPEEREGAGVVGRRRAGRLYERFGAPVLGRLVVTYPDAWRVSGEGAIELRDAVHRVVHDWGCATWGVDELGVHSYHHPAGDKDPHTWRPHGHFQVPLFGVVHSENGGRIAAMGPLAPHVAPAHLDDLRRRLGAVLGRFGLVRVERSAGRWFALGPDGARAAEAARPNAKPRSCGHCGGVAYSPGAEGCHACGWPAALDALASKANVWYQYEQAPAAKLHALRYDGRTFPAWYAGDLPRALRLGRSTGLLAPNRKLGGLSAWRAAVRGTAPELSEPEDLVQRVRAGIECYCGCGARPRVIDCTSAQGWAHVVVDAWAYSPTSPELREVRRLYGRGPPGRRMHDHQPPELTRSRQEERDDGIPY